MDKTSNNYLSDYQELNASELCMRLFLATGEIGYYCLYKSIENFCPYKTEQHDELILE